MSITGPAEGSPSKVGVAVVDLTTGMMAANAILAALYARERTGAGQHIDISLLETQVAWMANVASAYLITGEEPARHGNEHPTIVPYQTFRASDADFALGVGNDAQWRRLSEAIGWAELAEDPRFRTNPDRVMHRTELAALLAAHFATAPATDWVARIRAAGIPAGPVRTVAEVLEDPQILAREMVSTVEHPSIGELRLVGIPFKFSSTPASIRRPPPLLGEHTAEVAEEYEVMTTSAPTASPA
jgi:crotonobetainyl-CoA:carnitine CoA-transferase CaiB-like acyl-CoA transferase